MGLLPATCLLAAVVLGAESEALPLVPPTPPGLAGCKNPLRPNYDLPKDVGETIRYFIDVSGLSIGTVDFHIQSHGTHKSKRAVEYRCQFKIDDVVATVMPAEGRAASLVGDDNYWPLQAMNRYHIGSNRFDETIAFDGVKKKAFSHRTKNGTTVKKSRNFPGPALDFVGAFYFLRSLSADAQGCAIVYGNQRAYTFWIRDDGKETIMTPVGLRPARRYFIRFAKEKAKRPSSARVWISDNEDRLIYRAEMLTGTHMLARVHLYEKGKASSKNP